MRRCTSRAKRGKRRGTITRRRSKCLLAAIRIGAEEVLPPELHPPPWPAAPATYQLRALLSAWARACPRPLVLFFDEIDALRGRSLITVLRQLRDGYPSRPRQFPASVILCGLRDVRDDKAAAGGDPTRIGTSSPFNVKIESMRLGNLVEEEVAELYGQHTAATGQVFTPEAVARGRLARKPVRCEDMVTKRGRRVRVMWA